MLSATSSKELEADATNSQPGDYMPLLSESFYFEFSWFSFLTDNTHFVGLSSVTLRLWVTSGIIL